MRKILTRYRSTVCKVRTWTRYLLNLIPNEEEIVITYEIKILSILCILLKTNFFEMNGGFSVPSAKRTENERYT